MLQTLYHSALMSVYSPDVEKVSRGAEVASLNRVWKPRTTPSGYACHPSIEGNLDRRVWKICMIADIVAR